MQERSKRLAVQCNATRRNRISGRERDYSNRADVQPRQSHTYDMRFVRSVSCRSSAERSRLGGVELAPKEDLPRPGARLDDRRQTAGEDRRGKSVQVGCPDKA